jgi:hypothetical protein
LRCGKCGNENEAVNRFCGMCGAALVANDRAGAPTPVAGQTASGTAAIGTSAGTGEERRPAAASAADARSDAWPNSRPVISGGPSLLGLNVPSGDTGGRDSLRRPSDVDYLLEDEEEPRRSWGKLILIVVALLLAAGFGYVRWKQGGFDWLMASDKKPAAAATQTPEAAPGGDSTAAPGTTSGGAASSSGSQGDSGAPQNPAQTSSQAAPTQNPPVENAVPQSGDQPSAGQPGAGQSGAAQSGAAQSGAAQSDVGDSGAASEPESQSPSSDSEKKAAPAEVSPRQRAHKPSAAKPAAAKPVAAMPEDSVIEAERYIYGRGAGQDCDRGLRLLKPAAGQSNVRAMISLGALYSTGTCTPRDLPTAYRWFALALHKEPDNQALQDNLQKLWSQMTQPERQLAIRLSQ